MSDSLEISLDGSPLERAAQGVKSTLQDLQKALAAIDNLPANKLKASLRGITTLMAEVVADTDKTMDLLVKQAGAAGAKAGAAHAKGVRAGAKAGAEALLEETQQVSKKVKAEIVGMYSPYNARTVVASELKGIEGATTATWKSIYRHQRKLADEAADAQSKALSKDLSGWQHMLKLRVAAQKAAAEAASATQQEALRKDLEGWQQMLKLRVAAQAQAEAQAQALTLRSLGNSAKAMWSAKAQAETDAAKKYESHLDILNARIKQAHKARADALDSALVNLGRQSKSMWAAKADREKADAEAYVRNLDVLNARVKAAQARQAEALEAAAYVAARRAKALVNQAMTSPEGAYSSLQNGAKFGTVVTPKAEPAPRVPSDMSRTREESEKLSKSLLQQSGAANNLHSAYRGLASGFGMLWLTWGAALPLLTGAVISNAITQSVRQGAEVGEVLANIQHMGEVSVSGMRSINDTMLDLARTGVKGPQELAGAFEALSLAGLSAKEQVEAIKPVLNFSIAGGVDLKAAAESLVSVGTAYGYSAKNYGVVADVISKTAATSLASVEDMMEAFKQASTIAQQYQVDLKDVAAGLALLSNVGIKGSSAGTAIRNMFNELLGTSKQARAVIQDFLKLDIFDGNKLKPVRQIMTEIVDKLGQMDFKSQLQVLQAMGNERGTKALSAFLDGVVKKSKDAGKGLADVKTELDRILYEIENAAGFTAIVAIGKSNTAGAQFDGIKASLQAALVEAFQSVEPQITELAMRIRQALNSPEFTQALQEMVKGAMGLVATLLENRELLLSAAKAYIVYQAALAGAVVTTKAAALVTGVYSAAKLLLTRNSAAAAAGVVASNAALAATPAIAGRAAASMALLNASLGVAGAIAMAAGAAYYLFFRETSKGAEEAANSHRTLADATMENAEKELTRLKAVLQAREAGMDQLSAEHQATVQANLTNIHMAHQGKIAAMEEAKANLELARARKHAALSDPRYDDPGTQKRILGRIAQDDAGIEGINENIRLLKRARDAEMGRAVEVFDQIRTLSKRNAEQAEMDRQASAGKTFGNLSFDPDTFSGSGARAAKGLDAFTKSIKNNISAIASQADALDQAAKSDYDTYVRQMEARHAAGLVTEGAYQAELISVTARTEQQRIDMAARNNEEIVEEYRRLYDAYSDAAAKAINDSGLTGKDLSAHRKQVNEQLHGQLQALEESTRAQTVRNAAQIVQITNEAANRRVQAEIKAQGEIRKLRQETDEYWAENARDLAKDNAAYQLQQRFKDAGDDAPAFLKAEKAAADAAAQATERHASQLMKLEKALQDANKAREDFLVESAWQDAMWGSDTTAEQMEGARRLADYAKQLEEELAKFKVQMGEDVATRSATAYGRAMEAEIDRLKRGVSDSIVTALFEGGQAGKKKLRDLLVAELRKPVTMVVNVLVNALMSSLLGSGSASAATAAGGASGAASLLQTTSNAYSALTSSTWFSNFGGSVTNLINQAGGKLFNAGLEQLGGTLIDFSNTYASQITQFANVAGNALAAFQGLKSLADGNYGGAAGSAIGYYFGGPIGAAIGNFIGSSLNEALFGSAGTLHTGGAGSYSTEQGARYGMRDAQLGFGADALDEATAKGSEAISKALATALDGFASSFGRESGYWVGTGFADDTSDDGAWGALKVMLGGKTLADWGSGSDRWPGREFSNGEEGQKEYMAALAADVRDLLADSAPDWADAMLESLGDSVTLEQLGQVVNQINAVQAALVNLGDLMPQLSNLTDDASSGLLEVFGGIDNLTSTLQSYYQNYYSESERMAKAAEGVAETLEALGLQMPSTMDGFRRLVEAQDLTTASGRATYAALIGVSNTFAEVAKSAQAAGSAVSAANLESAWSVLGGATELLESVGGQGSTESLRALTETLTSTVDPVKRLEVLSRIVELEKSAAEDALQTLDEQVSAQKELAGLATDLSEFVQDLRTGSLSPSTPAQKLALAQQSFYSTLSSASAGDADAAAKLQGEASTYLEAARAYFASGNEYTSIFEYVTSALSSFAETSLEESESAALALEAQRELIGVSQGTRDLVEDLYRQAATQFDQGLQVITQQALATGGIKTLLEGLPAELAALITQSVSEAATSALAQFAAANSTGTSAQTIQDYASQVGSGSLTMDDAKLNMLAVPWVTARLAEGNARAVYDEAVKQGVTAARLDSLMGWPAGTSNEWAVQNNLPKFAKGGYHSGGWAIVGEQGPELAHFGAPARIYNANQSASMMSNDAMVAELRALRAEVSMLREQQGAETRALISSNFAAQEASADAIVSGVADAGERQVWSVRTQPVIK